MENKKGFTLVEILAVVAILAILAIAATLGITNTIQKQRQKLAYQAETNIAESSLAYFSNKGGNYVKSCTKDGNYIVISQKSVENLNKFLREDKFAAFSGESLYQELKKYSINGNADQANKYDLDPYISVDNRSCYRLVTVGELIDQGLISDADGMCNKASMIIMYRKADSKNTAGIMTTVQEAGICKSDRKEESGPVITVSPQSDLSFSASRKIDVIVTTETTNLKSSFTLKYGWSNSDRTKPSTWLNLSFSGNTAKKGSAQISVNTLDETRYLWIKAGTVLDNKNNKNGEILAGPYAFLPKVVVTYDVNTGNASSCPTKKTVVFTKKYNKNPSDVTENLCTPTKTGYDFNWWTYRDTTTKIQNNTTVTDKTDHTIKAKWTPHVYTITLNKNSATNTPTSSINVTYDSSTLSPSSITLPQRKYTVSGFTIDASRKSNGATVSNTSNLTSTYTFNGWTITKNSTDYLINNAASPSLIASVSGYTDENKIWKKAADVTLYARWTSANVTLPTIT